MPSPHHPRLMHQLEELGIDPDADLDHEALASLLDRVDKAYAEIDGSRHALMTVLDTLDSTTCHTDASGKLIGLNDPGLALFALPARELLSHPLMQTVHLEDEQGRRLTDADLSRPLRIEQGRVVRPDGSSAVVEISISQIASDRVSGGAVVRVRDIEERLERERELHEARVDALVARRAEQSKSRFLANLSHELRTPLNAIVGYSEMLLEEAVEDQAEQRTSDLRRIQAAGQHLTQLIGAVLDLSKIDAGRMELFPEDCDVVDVVKEARDAVLPQAMAKGLAVEVEVASRPPQLHIDKTRLRQCVLNLLANAVKFTDAGRVGVVLRSDDDAVRIRVEDSGVGISEEGLERIFDEFVQVDDSERRSGGSGLGLALSRRLCRLMGGDIEVGSEIGKGSTFTIVLPLPS